MDDVQADLYRQGMYHTHTPLRLAHKLTEVGSERGPSGG